MKTLKKKIFILFFMNCASQVNNAYCIDCGDKLLDGSSNKEVTLTEIPIIKNIAINAEIGKCIRFKIDGNNSIIAEIDEKLFL